VKKENQEVGRDSRIWPLKREAGRRGLGRQGGGPGRKRKTVEEVLRRGGKSRGLTS